MAAASCSVRSITWRPEYGFGLAPACPPPAGCKNNLDQLKLGHDNEIGEMKLIREEYSLTTVGYFRNKTCFITHIQVPDLKPLYLDLKPIFHIG